MATIQEIRALEDKIYSCVEQYIEGDYDDHCFALVVSNEGGNIECGIVHDAPSLRIPGWWYYDLTHLVRESNSGILEPDVDAISDIANNWLFLD
jgi:hypothetical protein